MGITSTKGRIPGLIGLACPRVEVGLPPVLWATVVASCDDVSLPPEVEIVEWKFELKRGHELKRQNLKGVRLLFLAPFDAGL